MTVRVWLRFLTIEAVRALARHPLRSVLAMLGIASAVATVIWVVAIGHATVTASEEELDKLGDSLVWLEAGSRNAAGVRTGSLGQNTLTVQDAAAIRAEMPLIARVSEQVDGGVQAIYGGRNWSTRFRGVSPDYRAIKRWEVADGEFFAQDDVDAAQTVVVLGHTVRRELFDDASPVGERIRINNVWFTVIGVLAAKGQTASGQDQDDTVMMPWTTAQRRIIPPSITWLDDVLCSAVSPDAIPRAAADLTDLMRERHHIQPGRDDDFNIRHPEELLKARIKSSRTLELLLLCMASIAMIVGGIGIMNVMLASVTQRTTEIGLRSALGATPGAIQVQFLGEAVMLTLAGGAGGVALSAAAAVLVERQLGWPLAMSLTVRLLALAFSVVVGLLFGFYPARRAAALDPIVALRKE